MANEVEIVVKATDQSKAGLDAARRSVRDFATDIDKATKAQKSLGEEGTEATESITEATEKAKKSTKGLGDETRKVSSEFDGLHAQALKLNAAFDQAADKFRLSDDDFENALKSAKAFGEGVKNAGDNAVDMGSKIHKSTDDSYWDFKRLWSVVSDSGPGKTFGSIGDSITDGIAGATKTAPTAMMALGPVLVPAALAVGAAAGGALVLGFGGAGAGLGIMAAAQAEDVQKKFSTMSAGVVKDFEKLSMPFEVSLLKIADMAEQSFGTFKPALQKSFADMAPVITDFTGNLLTGFEAFTPALDPITKAFSAVLDDLGPRMPGIIGGIADSMTDLSESIQESPAALGDMVEGLGKVVEAGIDATRMANDLWPAFKNFFTMGTSGIDDMQQKFQDLWGPKGVSMPIPGAIRDRREMLDKLFAGRSMYDAKDAAEALARSYDILADAEANAADRASAMMDIMDIAAGRTPSYEEAYQNLNDDIRELTDMFTTNGTEAENSAMKAKGWGDALLNADGTVNTITENGSKLQDTLVSLQSDFANSAAGVRELEDAGWSHDAAVQKVTEDLGFQRDRIIELGDEMGLSKDQMSRLLETMGLTPEQINTLINIDDYDARAKLRSLVATEYKTIQVQIQTIGGYAGTVNGETIFHDRLASGGFSSSGMSRAASGGQRNGNTLVHEGGGPEIIDLPNGSRVIPAGMTRGMDEAIRSGGGRGGALTLAVLPGALTGLEDMFVTWLKEAVRLRGGDPSVLGS